MKRQQDGKAPVEDQLEAMFEALLTDRLDFIARSEELAAAAETLAEQEGGKTVEVSSSASLRNDGHARSSLFMWGLALETAAKGCLFYRARLAGRSASRAMEEAAKDMHNITKLVPAAVASLGSGEDPHGVLALLEELVWWGGKYPTPKQASKLASTAPSVRLRPAVNYSKKIHRKLLGEAKALRAELAASHKA